MNNTKPIQKVVVLGGGSAGLLAALTLKRKVPELEIVVLHSPGIGIIGVGEGTAIWFVKHLFDYLKIDPESFYREAEPTWKLGIGFKWGKRERFYFSFSDEYAQHWKDMSRPVGFYCDADQPLGNVGPFSALMDADKAFTRRPDGRPLLHRAYSFHLENKKLARWLDLSCREHGVQFMEATVQDVMVDETGVRSLHTEDGRKIRADLFVDASGFRSELLGKALGVPFKSYDNALFCDRAVVGGWARTDEPVHPYTTSETMQCGWSWQIEHEHTINRGYVYSSHFISDEQAEQEFRAVNPKLTGPTRIVPFRSGRYERLWEKNVVGMGNAAGFLEPLEATALQVICIASHALADVLIDGGRRITPSLKKTFNEFNTKNWDDIRDFLALHYKFNDRYDNDFWRHCQEHSPLGEAQHLVDLYQENGPVLASMATSVPPASSFGLEGYLSLLVGMNVPHNGKAMVKPKDKQVWAAGQERFRQNAARAMTVPEALEDIRKHGVPT
jgi:tryptophan halogenase